MTRKSKKQKKSRQKLLKSKRESFKYPLLTSRVKHWIASILMFVFSLIISLSFFGKAGKGGELILRFFNFLIGKTTSSIPLLLILGGILFLKPQKKRIYTPIFGSILLLILGISGLFEILDTGGDKPGGILGYTLSLPFLNFFGALASSIFFSCFILISLLILWEFAPQKLKGSQSFTEKVSKILEKKLEKTEKPERKEMEKKVSRIEIPQFEIKRLEDSQREKERLEEKVFPKIRTEKEILPPELKGKYKTPPIEFLSSLKEIPSTGDVEHVSSVIQRTLANFGIQVEMGEINMGPTVTQYTLKPADGVKLTKITALTNDLALALASHPIRIEAPIPGRSLVGIEVPNKIRASVNLRELISQSKFQESLTSLLFPLGKDVSGIPVFADLGKMPHLLVAGSTGSGKTIFLQNLIVSLIYRNSPQILRFVLIDPKRVEFPIYNQLPHLLTPVIFNAEKTVNLLNWLIGEMERRFEIMSEVKARDIKSFNQVITKNSKLKTEYGIMPYIVLVIDELADLMAAKGREVEAGIVRLSQLARAVGIHLVVATQRPSVDVITGLIKANLTSRVAFQVASQVDSRTILDTAGAESLLGNGDMLYLSSEFGKPKRIQGSFVIQKDVKKVIDFISRENKPGEKEEEIEERLTEELEKLPSEGPTTVVDFEDPLYEEAKKIVLEYKKASASLLQRRLRIGYARAARLLDILEDKGIVGPADGAKPREVYLEENDEYQDLSDKF